VIVDPSGNQDVTTDKEVSILAKLNRRKTVVQIGLEPTETDAGSPVCTRE